MASAILTSRNDPRARDYMTNFTNNTHLNFTRLKNIQNPNPNSNPYFNRFFAGNFSGNTSRDAILNPHRQPPYSAPPQHAFTGPPFNTVPAKSYGYRYVTFRLSSFSKRELKELRKRFIWDLERVRILRQQLELPAAPAGGRRRTNHASPAKKQCRRPTNAQKRKMMMRECGKMLGKLMKHKHGWVFNTPVDAAALKLYDYHNIITNPMDLGTIKRKLTKNQYESALAFASDVRLTFNNAMVYNGKGSNVYIMAERLLFLFEDMFVLTHWASVVNRVKKPNRAVNVSRVSNLGTAMVARVSNKPEMTEEQKSELAESFGNLKVGPEEVDQIMDIVKKGVMGLEHKGGGEIELDFEVLDSDTLWGLHAFIARTRAAANFINCEQVEEEDVDIGEEMQLTVYPSIEIEKDTVNVSSNGSSSDDSSSSDSGSGTCSGKSGNEEEVNSTPKVVA